MTDELTDTQTVKKTNRQTDTEVGTSYESTNFHVRQTGRWTNGQTDRQESLEHAGTHTDTD